MAFSDYLALNSDKLLFHLSEVQQDLATLYDQLYFAKREELRLKAEGWAASTAESTATARSKASNHRALDASLTILELEGKEKALVEEKFFLVRVLDQSKPH